MFNELIKILSDFGVVSSRNLPVTCHYITACMLEMKKHSFEAIAKLSDCHPSRFSVLLNAPETLSISKELFDRTLRRKLKRVFSKNPRVRIIIDATFVKRKGKKVENSKTYHSGSGYVKGHKLLNIVLVQGEKVIPLATIPLYSKEYCEKKNIEHRTEPDVVVEWLEQLKSSPLFEGLNLTKTHFLMDSGYDVKRIEKSIANLGAYFVVALKTSRIIKDRKVTEYFKSHKKGHKAKTIRFIGSGKKRKTFTVRLAAGVHLKGVGAVNVVCSKEEHGLRKAFKYIATNNCSLEGKGIVGLYKNRWDIETWHKEVKQKYGYGDCMCSLFSAVNAHINFVLIAYLLADEIKDRQRTSEDFKLVTFIKKLRVKITQIGKTDEARIMISNILQRI